MTTDGWFFLISLLSFLFGHTLGYILGFSNAKIKYESTSIALLRTALRLKQTGDNI